MKKLIVMYKENPEDPKGTWSGTSYALRKALEEFSEVIFIDSSDTKLMKCINWLTVKLGKYMPCYLLGKAYRVLDSYYANKKIRPYSGIPVLEIANEIIVKNPYFLYQDLSYANWVNARKAIESLGVSFENGNVNKVYCERELIRRINWQRKLYIDCQKTFYMGKWTTEEMIALYPELKNKFVHAGGGLNAEFNLLPREKVNHRILFCGIDFERKGGDVVLQAFKLLKKKVPDATLSIIGPDNRENADGVTWFGRVPREVISKELSKAELFCMPSVFEAYGLAFIEALCYGVPIIARDAYEMAHFVEHGKSGYLIKDNDANILADYMYQAFENKAMQEYVTMNAENYRKEYCWSTVAKNISKEIFG